MSSIADRRARLYSDEIGSFENCLENKVEYKTYEKKLQDTIMFIKNKLKEDGSFGRKYLKLFNYIEAKYNDGYNRALAFMVIDISYRRDVLNGQLSLLDDVFSEEKYEDFYKENVSVAAYYLSVRAKLPYYYGFDMIKDISSYNIEQFLAFSGSIFEQYVAGSIVQSKQKRSLRISPAEQERYLQQVATQRYNEILSKFEYGKNIQNLFNNLSRRSQWTRDKGTNPYAGGAATGVAIAKSSLKELNTEKYGMLAKVISDCISSNYFEKRTIMHSSQEWMVLYYNRWLCVHYNLPLSYGGWFRATLSDLNAFLQPPDKKQKREDLPIEIAMSEVLS